MNITNIIIVLLVALAVIYAVYEITTDIKEYIALRKRIKAYDKLKQIAKEQNKQFFIGWNNTTNRWEPMDLKHPLLFTSKKSAEAFAKDNEEIYKQVFKN